MKYQRMNGTNTDGTTDTEADRTELIEAGRKKKTKSASASQNGNSLSAESSPLHTDDDSGSILCSPQNHGLRVIIVSSVVFSLAVTVALILTIFLAPKEVSGNAAVVAGDARCAVHGLKILQAGGNAVDGAVSTAFCLAVVEPQHSGLGGGGFAIVHDHKFENSYGYDFRESAPAALTSGTLDIPGLRLSAVSTGVPGMLKGLAALHTKHGKLPWKDLVTPSIKLAKEGFTVSQELADSLKALGDPGQFDSLASFKEAGGQWKNVNETVTLTSLANTLTQIQKDKDALYSGSLKSLFVKEMQDVKGLVTAKDLTGYNVVETQLLKSQLHDLTLLTLPPPAAGPLLALVMNMAQKYVPATIKTASPVSSRTYHQLIETFKFAFGQMSQLGDPAVEKAVEEEVKFLLSDALASELVAKIGNDTNPDPSYYGPTQPSGHQGTAQISVIDSSELMVSISLSTGDLFGNKLVLPGTGIFLNDNLAEFTLASSGPPAPHDRNLPAPKKRPQSTLCPAIVYNSKHPCDRRLALGAVHGPPTLTGLAQVLLHNLLYKQTVSDSLSAPRVHNQLQPNYTEYESALDGQIVKDLQQRGHDMRPVSKLTSEVTGIRKVNDDLTFGLDPRSLSAEAHY